MEDEQEERKGDGATDNMLFTGEVHEKIEKRAQRSSRSLLSSPAASKARRKRPSAALAPSAGAVGTTATSAERGDENRQQRPNPRQLAPSPPTSFPLATIQSRRTFLADIEASSSSSAGVFHSYIEEVRVTHCDSRFIPSPTTATHVYRDDSATAGGSSSLAPAGAILPGGSGAGKSSIARSESISSSSFSGAAAASPARGEKVEYDAAIGTAGQSKGGNKKSSNIRSEEEDKTQGGDALSSSLSGAAGAPACAGTSLSRATTTHHLNPTIRREKQHRNINQQVIGFATVTDQSGAVVSLLDPGNRFGSFFRRAQEEGKALSLSNMLSKKQSDIYGRRLASEELVLWSTRRTSVYLLENQAAVFSGTSTPGDKRQTSHASEAAATGTLYASGAGAIDNAFHAEDQQQHYFNVESPLLDISIYNNSLTSSLRRYLIDEESDVVVTPFGLRERLLSVDGSHYQKTMLKIKPIESLVVVDEQGQQCRIQDMFFADSQILKTLCGGICPADWYGDASSFTTSRLAVFEESTLAASQLAWNALWHLRALLIDAVPLRWTIDLGRRPAEIVQVTLPKI